MNFSTTGSILRATTFGESHGAGVGVVIDGVPAGLELPQELIQRQLDRRRPGTSKFVSPRNEADEVEILSGLADGRTLGTPIALLVRNTNQRSKDYGDLLQKFRPGHADYAYFQKYGIAPQPGGGRSSGRETTGRVAAGAVARAILGPQVCIQSATVALGELQAREFDFGFAETHPLRFCDPQAADAAEKLVEEAMSRGDSVGGIVELRISGIPAGLGEPVFGKLDALLGGALFSIGGVKGVEFGVGFEAARMYGSRSNDPITPDTQSNWPHNHAGGILGGISTGQEIIARIAVKPTPSISLPQQTTDLAGQACEVVVKGRHDPCLCPRVGVVAEAMLALVLADCLLLQRARR